MSSFRRAALAVLLVLVPSVVAAQQRILELRFTPAKRVQIAIWIERDDGTFLRTLLLTEAVAKRGIGNRPGALQMNSGFRWPYGRREGVLPLWAHRRAAAPGAQPFRRVIFQNRLSEGYASRTSVDSTRDDYFCLSFNNANNNNVDATTCASVFNSDKGRYITQADVDGGYHEPFATSPGVEIARPLDLFSLYPPRLDVTQGPTIDHPDVAFFASDARAVMPELDAVTSATFAPDVPQLVQFLVPAEWPDGSYVAWVEVNTEKDNNATYSASAYPTPNSMEWDWWAINTGYAYRGQPSVVYEVPFTLAPAGGDWSTGSPVGYGELQGLDGNLRPLDATITDDPDNAPGSGADRLHRMGAGGPRVAVHVVPTSVCSQPNPPSECFVPCQGDTQCASGFLCGSMGTCEGYCDVSGSTEAPSAFEAKPVADEKHSHEWAHLTFTAPPTRRRIVRYDVRVSTTPITNDAQFLAAENAKAASAEFIGVSVCPTDPNTMLPACPASGSAVAVDIGKLVFQTHYYVAMRAIDDCGYASPIATTEFETTAIHFTTVTPCFIATAAYGSPMAAEVRQLRWFRDEYLMPSQAGRAFVRTYYAVSPPLADAIRENDSLRAAARFVLTPIVSSVRFLAWLRDE